MNGINNIPSSESSDVTQVFFNNYYTPAFSIAQDIDDAIISFFERITNSKESARILATSVVYTSLATNIDPIETLAKFSTLGDSELSAYTTLFLNLNRVNTSYLGINNSAKVGKYVQRTLLP